ncbi:hypothetical protein SAMN02787144_101854 [Streptomyces atratus]|uniref:Uncharacterized protein n=1 Tax=Streptomyces atratus TaxID=1893 RepID=A0A1K2EAL4_STRAR|nr:hypothetical protein SAMN02787144_101854 [Streptomyces atratus]
MEEPQASTLNEPPRKTPLGSGPGLTWAVSLCCHRGGVRNQAKAVLSADQAIFGSERPWYIVGISLSTSKWW